MSSSFPPIRDPRQLPTGGEPTSDVPTVPAPADDDDEPLLLSDPLLLNDPLPPLDGPSADARQPPQAPPRSVTDGRPRDDEPIPMLTEVVQVPRYEADDIPQSFADVDWGELAQKVRENVLERLLRRSDALLDSQIQATLTPVLERAAEAVAREMHDAMTRMIRDVVARAVTEELTRLHAEIARRNRTPQNKPRS